jgi:hypothetical protein
MGCVCPECGEGLPVGEECPCMAVGHDHDLVAVRAAKRQQDQRRRDRMRANGPVERFTVAEIGERDRWLCGICRDPDHPGLGRGRVRDDIRGYVVERLGDPDGVLIADDTGFLKKGTRSAGVQRQYSGTAGRTENCQVGVFLADASEHGHALIDRELYLPQSWAEEADRRWAAGIPEDVEFTTKPRQAQAMISRAIAAGVPFGWFTADETYGQAKYLQRHFAREPGAWRGVRTAASRPAGDLRPR